MLGLPLCIISGKPVVIPVLEYRNLLVVKLLVHDNLISLGNYLKIGGVPPYAESFLKEGVNAVKGAS